MKRDGSKRRKVRKQIFDASGLKAFAIQLKKVRGERGFTQADLSHNAGVSISQVARIETAKINPTLSTIFQIARALDVPPSKLFDFKLPVGPKKKP
jgi:transcriptional regulator with XRE-family HTH domain